MLSDLVVSGRFVSRGDIMFVHGVPVAAARVRGPTIGPDLGLVY